MKTIKGIAKNKAKLDDFKKFKVIEPHLIEKIVSLPKEEGIRLFKRINYKMYLAKDKILKQAFDEKLFTEEEYEEKYKDMFYDDYGSDSFMQYINAVMNAKINCFVTINERILKRKEELRERFGLRIASLNEILKETER